MNAHPLMEAVQVLAFDIFGTVVDWHGSIVREMAALHPGVDGDAFARAGFDEYRVAQFDELTDGLRGGGDARFSW